MASVNKVILVGNLGKDPEVKYTAGGQAMCRFSLATSERWKNKDSGQYEEKTEWHNIVAWGKVAELCKEYLTKGRSVYLEGRLQTRSWDDKDGNKRYTTEIVVQTVQFLGSRTGVASQPASQPEQVPVTQASDEASPPTFNPNEDVPF